MFYRFISSSYTIRENRFFVYGRFPPRCSGRFRPFTLPLFLCCFTVLFASPPVFALETWTNSIGMEFVKIPSGAYLRGCDPNVEQCGKDEMPQRRISISTFWLGKYEVTQEQWVAVMGSNPSKFKLRTKPVEMVTWYDAQEFARRLNAKEGHNRYRLPTEAEWEYAARAGSTTAYSFGDDARELGDYAWYKDAGGSTHPVGQLRPNAWGLHDMHGNVREWVNDMYDWGRDYYRSSSDTDPQGTSAPRNPTRWEWRVTRGGSFSERAWSCRSAHREATPSEPPPHPADGKKYGFRLALSPER